MNRTTRCDRSRWGFTLIELLVVIALIGLALGYVALHIGDLIPSSRLGGAARAIGNAMTEIEQHAVFFQRPYYIQYDVTNQQYRFMKPTTIEEQDQGLDPYIYTQWKALPQHVRFEDIQFSGQDKAASGIQTVEFSPTGEVQGYIVHLVSDQIADETDSQYSIELNPTTDLVSYSRGYKEYAQVKDEFDFR